MLISFTVGNYRSFKEPVTLSMEVEPRVTGLEEENLISLPNGKKLLNVAAIYGANASGKSNLINAFSFMRRLVLDSSKNMQQDEPISVQPFLLDDDGACAGKPSHFEISCLIDGVVYEYGFEATQKEITCEWLIGSPAGRRTEYFDREGQTWTKISRKYFKEGIGLEERTRPNALFLSTAAQFNGPAASAVLRYFRDNIGFLNWDRSMSVRDALIRLARRIDDPATVEELLCKLDLNIMGIRIVEEEAPPMPADVRKIFSEEVIENLSVRKVPTMRTKHVTPSGREVEFDLLENESDGARKMVSLAGPVAHFLANGGTFFLDELEASLHPLLTMAILRFFQSNATNPKNAQIIFTTHDANLLSQRVNLLRRDQVWFTEKRLDSSTDLYCLCEFAPRNDEAIDRNYLRGKYGAVPFLGELSYAMEFNP